jgi:hypothetical protein
MTESLGPLPVAMDALRSADAETVRWQSEYLREKAARQAAEAEVAALRKRVDLNRAYSRKCEEENAALRERCARLEAGIREHKRANGTYWNMADHTSQNDLDLYALLATESAGR